MSITNHVTPTSAAAVMPADWGFRQIAQRDRTRTHRDEHTDYHETF